MAASLDGTNGLTFNDGTQMGSANSLGIRNRIINGDMRIDQRNNGAAVTAPTVSSYLLDRFFSQNSTATGNITIQQSTLGISRSHRATVTSAVTDLSGGLQVQVGSHIIEAQNCFDLNGKNINISFRVETNWSGNFAVAINNSDATRSYIVDVPVVPGTNTVSVPITLEAASVLTNTNAIGLRITFGYNNEGSRRSATTNAWVSGYAGCSTSSTLWAKTTGNFINVTDVQLEEGSVATPFERRPIGLELALTQRYFEVGFFRLDAYGLATNSFSSSTNYKATKRATPTIVFSSTGFANASGIYAQVSSNTSSLIVGAITTSTGGCAFETVYTSAAEL